MYNSKSMEIQANNQQELKVFGARLGEALSGGEVIELVGDVGAGKTTLVKAIAAGMGIMGDISSPSYTLSQVYEAPSGLRLMHYDFYRLHDPGILANELAENIADTRVVTAVEWGGIVAGVLPPDRLQIRIVPLSETARQLTVTAYGSKGTALLERLA